MEYYLDNINKESLYKSVIHCATDAIVIIDEKCQVRLWNHSAEKLFGYSVEFMLGKNMHDYITPKRHYKQAKTKFDSYQLDKNPDMQRVIEIESVNKDGKEIWIELSLTSINVNDNIWTFAFVRNIEHKKEYEQKLKRISITDPLTNLYNRREFQRVLEESMDTYLTLIMMDIDDFKRINDTYGHPAGDDGICMVANKITSNFSSAACSARIGGEEFGILLISKDIDDVYQKVDIMRDEISKTKFSNFSLNLTTSIGISYNKRYVRELLSSADEALYKSKGKGKNTITISDELLEN